MLLPLAILPDEVLTTPSTAEDVIRIPTTITELQQQLEPTEPRIQLQNPVLTIDPAQLSLAHTARPATAPNTLKRPQDHRQRAERRKMLRKTLNRNGNRNCAWCEPRREPRKYGPRRAPENKMTCGCNFEDALFEETLAWNGVGSMDTTQQRLDPKLRHALLVLLKKRYRYQDGDLDFDHDKLEWMSGGNAASWMAREKFD